jgi:hypothetical protein
MNSAFNAYEGGQYLSNDGATQAAVWSPLELRDAVLFVPRRAEEARDVLATRLVGLMGQLSAGGVGV